MDSAEKYGEIFNLLAKAKGEDGLDTIRLHDEIKKEIEAGKRTFGMFLEVVESLQDIIPKEKQRYNAAARALSKTTGESRQDLLESTDRQLEELKNVEEAVSSALYCLSDELKEMDSRLQKTKDELAKLREKVAELEKEEQEILDDIAAREGENKVVERTVRKVFRDIGAEIAGVRKKIEEFTCENVSPQPVTPPGPIESGKVEEEGIETEEHPAPQETKWTKKCPFCGGQMNFHTSESIWKCYTCGNEESEKDAAGVNASAAVLKPAAIAEPVTVPESQVAEAVATPEQMLTAVAEPPAAPSKSSSSVNRSSPRKKTCPVCHKQMTLYEDENTWKCPFCNYQRREF